MPSRSPSPCRSIIVLGFIVGSACSPGDDPQASASAGGSESSTTGSGPGSSDTAPGSSDTGGADETSASQGTTTDLDTSTSAAGVCGDGELDPGEDCDDGNDEAGDGCESDCSFSCEAAADCGEALACQGAPSCVEHVCTQQPPPPAYDPCSVDEQTEGVCVDGECVPSCEPTAAFDVVELVPELNEPGSTNLEAFLTDDELTVWFSSDRGGGAGDLDIWTSSRASTGDAFDPPVVVEGINASGRQSYPSVTADGLELYAQTEAMAFPFAVVVATRESAMDPFGPLELVTGPNDDNAYDPFVIHDGSALYFGSDRDGSRDLYRAARDGVDPSFGPVEPVPSGPGGVNTDAIEGHPVSAFGERVLYFGSDRSGPMGGGDVDVYVVSRDDVADPYGEASFIAGVSGPDREHPTWISADQCTLYFQRQLGGQWQIWRATRQP